MNEIQQNVERPSRSGKIIIIKEILQLKFTLIVFFAVFFGGGAGRRRYLHHRNNI